jgi:cation transport ATPase
LIILASLLPSSGCDTPGQNLSKESGQGHKTRVYEVFGMNCPGCHGGLEKLANKVPAVGGAQANWVEKRLTITVRAGVELNDEDIYDAIRRANFTPGKRLK